MTKNDVQILTADAEKIAIHQGELALRLKADRSFQTPLLQKCRERLQKVISYRCAYIRTPLFLKDSNICDFGFMTIQSRDLFRNLSGCKEAFVLAVTTGIQVDRLLMRLNVTSQAEHFMTDALSSAAVESFCDYVCELLQKQADCAVRFSPGYGDVSIEYQKPLLERLGAYENLGITLNAAYLMTPVKSITAIMGIKNIEGVS